MTRSTEWNQQALRCTSYRHVEDLRYDDGAWQYHSFAGNRWQHIRKDERNAYLKNAYLVLLTRARQGMVLVVPEGAAHDPTRYAAYYDGTLQLLRSIGLRELT